MRKITIILFGAILVSGAIYLGFKLCRYRQGKIHETRVELQGGDTLIHQTDWWGREPFLNDSSPRNSLFIEWRSEKTRELITDIGWISILPATQCRLYRESGVVLIQTPYEIFWRCDGDQGKWKRWSILNPKRTPLYSFIRDRSASDPRSSFREIPQERGKRLAMPAPFSAVYIGDEVERTWSLPYRFADIDLRKNLLIMALEKPVAGLPQQIVFSGTPERIGEWEFDLPKTTALGTNLP